MVCKGGVYYGLPLWDKNEVWWPKRMHKGKHKCNQVRDSIVDEDLACANEVEYVA